MLFDIIQRVFFSARQKQYYPRVNRHTYSRAVKLSISLASANNILKREREKKTDKTVKQFESWYLLLHDIVCGFLVAFLSVVFTLLLFNKHLSYRWKSMSAHSKFSWLKTSKMRCACAKIGASKRERKRESMYIGVYVCIRMDEGRRKMMEKRRRWKKKQYYL